MIVSMTGFGKTVVELAFRKVTIEIRSLNSKQLDLNLRIPVYFRDKEFEIRSILSKKLERGKVDLSIFVENLPGYTPYTFNRPLAKRYADELIQFSNELGIDCSAQLLGAIVKMPEIITDERKDADEKDWENVLQAFHETIKALEEFRNSEGVVLSVDIRKRLNTILELLDSVEQFEIGRIVQIREKLQKNLQELLGKELSDPNRFEQELIYYLEKIDITEEKVRLRKHCEYFLETMGIKENNGRKLAFIAQEMGREINTLGSKANDAGIQRIVVQMKDELEKIKEQLLNIL